LDDSQVSDEEYYRNILRQRYGWKIRGKFSIDELRTILSAAEMLVAKLNQINGVNGLSFMNSIFSNITIGRSIFGSSYVRNDTILLTKSWLVGGEDEQHFIHELAHVVDNRLGTGQCSEPTFCGGGPADDLARYVGGDPDSSSLWRWMNGTSGIPNTHQWKEKAHSGYGNEGTTEYFAEAIGWWAYDDSNLPPDVGIWIETFIYLNVNVGGE
jgi:hypothetical protein